MDGSKAWRRKPYRWRLPGLYTDDTQQALVLAEVLLRHGAVVPEAVAGIYLELAHPRGSYLGAHRAVGRSFRRMMDELERGVPPEAAGQDSAGIGAAMRIAPVAAYYATGPAEDLFEPVVAASLMTHRDIRSLAGAVAVASAVRRLLLGEERTASLLFRVAGDVARAEARLADEPGRPIASADVHRHAVSSAIVAAERVLDLPREPALAALAEEANHHGAEPPCRRPTLGFPPALIPACLYLLLTTEGFEEALVEVVNLGNDADSAGAILGALAGAAYGLPAIPERWLDGLRNRRGIDGRAFALARHSTEGLVLPDLIETERQLSQMEALCRDDLMARVGRNGGDLGANRRL